jgi:hypothetical protein
MIEKERKGCGGVASTRSRDKEWKDVSTRYKLPFALGDGLVK